MTTPTIRHERMSDIFHKFHIENFGVNAVLHQFDKPEPIDADAHDHPGDFRTFIMDGSYVERVWHFWRDSWHYQDIHRKKGSSHFVRATHIHQIVELPDGPCKTIILPGPVVRKSGFWRFENGIASFREWNQQEFKQVGI